MSEEPPDEHLTGDELARRIVESAARDSARPPRRSLTRYLLRTYLMPIGTIVIFVLAVLLWPTLYTFGAVQVTPGTLAGEMDSYGNIRPTTIYVHAGDRLLFISDSSWKMIKPALCPDAAAQIYSGIHTACASAQQSASILEAATIPLDYHDDWTLFQAQKASTAFITGTLGPKPQCLLWMIACSTGTLAQPFLVRIVVH